MSDTSDSSLATKAVVAAGAAIGSAAIAAAVLFIKRRKDKTSADAQTPAGSATPRLPDPQFPSETD